MGNWYVRVRGRVLGPFPIDKLQDMRDRGQLQSFFEVSNDGTNWKTAGSVADLFPQMGITRRPTPAAPPPASPGAATHAAAPAAPAPRPRRGSLALFLILGGASALVVVLGVVVVVLVFVLSRDKGGTTDRAGVITFTPKTEQTEQYDTIKSSVGLVVCALDVVYLDGQHKEIILSTGTSFAVTPDGFLLTNHHVVSTVVRMAEPGALTALTGRLKAKKITPIVWVLFGSRNDKHLADIRYTSKNYDLAVLKIDRPAKKFFAMSAKKRDEIVPGLAVAAYGFPGIQRTIHDKLTAKKTDEALGSWEQVFASDQSYTPNREDGTVTSETYEYVADESEDFTLLRKPIVIQHRADIYAGNSGGPLLLADGTVVGINTYRVVVSKHKDTGDPRVPKRPDWDEKRVNLSLTLPQIHDEIDRNVPGIVWR